LRTETAVTGTNINKYTLLTIMKNFC